jgi:hypothetical protein
VNKRAKRFLYPRLFDDQGMLLEIEGTDSAERAERFIELYSSIYGYIGRNNELEDAFDAVANSHDARTEFQDVDVVTVLVWKTGGKFDRAKGTVLPPLSSSSISVREVKGLLNEFRGQGSIDSTDFIERATKIRGIGRTYAITLLHVASGGAFPIYDRFADIALQSILDTGTPKLRDPSYKIDSKNWADEYARFREDLTEVFGETASSRRVDQAMWTYGHLFSKSSKSNVGRFGYLERLRQSTL